MTPRIAKIDPISIANGPGIRVAAFVSGCRNGCKNCFNPEAQSFAYGIPYDNTTLAQILDTLASPHVAGLTLLGGEPLEPENQQMTLDICKSTRRMFKGTRTIWLYTGFVFEDLLCNEHCRAHTPLIHDIIDAIDVIVDGPFVQAKHDITLRFRGSANQRLIDVKKTLDSPSGTVITWDDGDVRGRM